MWSSQPGMGYNASDMMMTNPTSATTAGGSMIPSHISQNQRNDVFVGNLAFGTTEDQLYQAFADLGRIIKVRMVTDENGKPRGFAFIEFEDPASALSAIRNMNDYEINGRRIRVNFSNSSHLETLAGKLGMVDITTPSMNSNNTATNINTTNVSSMLGTTNTFSSKMDYNNAMSGGGGTHSVAEALKGLSKGESYDIIQQLKIMTERDPEEARKVISAHPQLPEAILYLMSKLNMIQTPILTNNNNATVNNTTATSMMMTDSNNMTNVIPPTSMMTMTTAPTMAIPSATATTLNAARPVDPRARVDPRTGAPSALVGGVPRVDPRMVAKQPPTTTAPATTTTTPANMMTMIPPPPPAVPIMSMNPNMAGVGMGYNPYMMPPPPQPQQPLTGMTNPTPVVGVVGPTSPSPSWIVAAQILGLDLDLVQKVMALTPQQIGQLPPDKQQSILALRQQITNVMTQNQQQQQRFKMEP